MTSRHIVEKNPNAISSLCPTVDATIRVKKCNFLEVLSDSLPPTVFGRVGWLTFPFFRSGLLQILFIPSSSSYL